MRPRIVGATARIITSFQGDDETVATTTDRLLEHGLDMETLMRTLARWDFPGEPGSAGQIRPRISDDTAARIEAKRRGDEQYTHVVDRLLFAGEWDGIDVEVFEANYGDPYVASLRLFADWYDRERPPSAFDVEEWLASLSDDYEDSTLRRHYHAVKAYFKSEIGDWDEPAETPTRDALIDALNELAADLGKTPTTRDVFDLDDFGIHHFQNEFGTWNNALRAAGFEPNEEKSGEYTDEELIEDLREFADELGDVPTSSQMVEEGPHSTSTYINRFGSWSAALEAADLSLNERYGRTAEAN